MRSLFMLQHHPQSGDLDFLNFPAFADLGAHRQDLLRLHPWKILLDLVEESSTPMEMVLRSYRGVKMKLAESFNQRWLGIRRMSILLFLHRSSVAG